MFSGVYSGHVPPRETEKVMPHPQKRGVDRQRGWNVFHGVPSGKKRAVLQLENRKTCRSVA